MTIKSIPFPAFATFEQVDRKDGKGAQMQFRAANMADGRKLIIVPDRDSLAPLEGVSIPITPNRVIFEGPSLVIATCFVPERFSLAHQVKAMLFSAEKKQAPKPKPAPKPCSGQFTGAATLGMMDRETARRKLDGANVLSFAELAEEQRQATARLIAKKNAGKKQKEPKKEKGSKSAKGQKRATA